ncbi:MAG: hypothetical protein ACTSVI_01605 [Promethearchaeota archaeon]
MYKFAIPIYEFNALKNKGVFTVAVRPSCGHFNQVFLDNNMRVRRSQCADLVVGC